MQILRAAGPATVQAGAGGRYTFTARPDGVAVAEVYIPADAAWFLGQSGYYRVDTVGIDQTTPGTTDRITAVSSSGPVAAEFARPNDTTAYAQYDAIANSTGSPALLTFTNLARANGGSGDIRKVHLLTDNTAWANQGPFELHLYHTAITAVADNAQFATLWANRANRVGVIALSNLTGRGTGGTAVVASNTTDILKFSCAAGSRNLFGVLVYTGSAALTPAANQNFRIELDADQN